MKEETQLIAPDPFLIETAQGKTFVFDRVFLDALHSTTFANTEERFVAEMELVNEVERAF